MGVATSCDDGILPFGLRRSEDPLCQNRITGDPRTNTGCPGRAGSCAGIHLFCRKIFGASPDADRRDSALAAT
ncbi:hypothetical protein EAO69_18555 [Streptomyces sp. me109]|nr:hypothetical protein EAO69_18555 [Streptomyces sp. me109]